MLCAKIETKRKLIVGCAKIETCENKNRQNETHANFARSKVITYIIHILNRYIFTEVQHQIIQVLNL